MGSLSIMRNSMAFGCWKRLISTVLLLAKVAVGQQPAQPSFEVVSIRAVPQNVAPMMRSQDFTPILPGGQYVDSRTMLLFMISFAFDVKNPSQQLLGLPNWAKNESYSVSAKPGEDFSVLAPGENQERVRVMMRNMLADRFQLRLHTETRQERIYGLEVGKGGMCIQEVAAPVPPAKEGYVGAAMSDRDGRMVGNKSTMAGMAMALALFLKQPVVDQTGLKGYYDFDVRWRAPEALEGQSSGGLGTEGLGLLISNLQSQFGLQLKKMTGPVTYWVVDNVEPPTEN